MGMNLQSSTLIFDETGKPFHVQQAEQIRAYKRRLERSRPHARRRAFRSAARSSR